MCVKRKAAIRLLFFLRGVCVIYINRLRVANLLEIQLVAQYKIIAEFFQSFGRGPRLLGEATVGRSKRGRPFHFS